MRYLFYYYNCQGTLIFDYLDENGKHTDQCYMGYSLREAISRFRKQNNLQHKHITVQKLF